MSRLAAVILAADIVASIIAGVIAFSVRYGFDWVRGDLAGMSAWTPALLAVVLVWPFVFMCLRLDGFRDGWHFSSITASLSIGVVMLVTILLALGYVSREYYSRFVLGTFGVVVFVLFFFVRLAARSILRSQRWQPVRKVVIVGNGNVAHELARKIQRHPELGREFAGFLFPTGGEIPAGQDLGPTQMWASPTSAASLNIPSLLQSAGVQELIVCLPESYRSEATRLVSICRKEGIAVSIVPQWYELYLSDVRLLNIEGLPLVTVQQRTVPVLRFALKRAFDLVLSPVLAVLALPICTCCALMLYIRKGKGLDQETRCGLHGRPFKMWRLNVDRAAPADGLEQAMLNLSLTELPQLWNVMSGDMSLVGPRPEPPSRVRHYSEWQRERLSIIPGMTGLAQVNGLRDVHSSEEKARFDLHYMYDWSPFVDVVLLAQTFWALAARLLSQSRHTVAHAPSLFNPPSPHQGLPEVLHVDRTHSSAN